VRIAGVEWEFVIVAGKDKENWAANISQVTRIAGIISSHFHVMWWVNSTRHLQDLAGLIFTIDTGCSDKAKQREAYVEFVKFVSN